MQLLELHSAIIVSRSRASKRTNIRLIRRKNFAIRSVVSKEVADTTIIGITGNIHKRTADTLHSASFRSNIGTNVPQKFALQIFASGQLVTFSNAFASDSRE